MVKFSFHKFDDEQSDTSFKILNDIIPNTPLDLWY